MEREENLEVTAPNKVGKTIWLIICILSSVIIVFSPLNIYIKLSNIVLTWLIYVFYKNKTFWLVLLALIGLGLSIKLTIIYYMVNFVPNAMPSFCAINDVIDCDAVAGTKYAQILGVPTACFGLFLYSFVFGMCFVDKLQNIKGLGFLKVFKDKFSYIFTIYCLSFTVSMYLMAVQFIDIKKFCLLCFITYFVDFVSLFIAKDYKKPLLYEIKTSVKDFFDAMKIKGYVIALILMIIGASGVFAYTKTSYIFTPGMKNYDAIMYFQKMKGNPFKIHGNVLGNPDGEVVVYEFSDFECPWCKIMNRMLQKAATEYDNVYVVHYNFPLDMKCNPALKRPFHNNSCTYAGFAIAAKKQNKYWEMVNMLFDKQPKSNQELFKQAEKLKIDSVELANEYIKNSTSQELQNEIMEGLKKEINSTPSIFINGKKYEDEFTYEKLTETLEKAGAKKKEK